MEKMNLILSGSLLVMSLGVFSPAVVYAGAETETAQEDENGEMSWVFDDCGILSDDEITELNDELATIYDTYGYDARSLDLTGCGRGRRLSSVCCGIYAG